MFHALGEQKIPLLLFQSPHGPKVDCVDDIYGQPVAQRAFGALGKVERVTLTICMLEDLGWVLTLQK